MGASESTQADYASPDAAATVSSVSGGGADVAEGTQMLPQFSRDPSLTAPRTSSSKASRDLDSLRASRELDANEVVMLVAGKSISHHDVDDDADGDNDANGASEAGPAAPASFAARTCAFLKKQYFLLGIFASIALAAAVPSVGLKNGPLAPQVTIKYVLVPFIFLTSGLKLKLAELQRAIRRPHVHLLVQTFNYAFIGFTMFGFAEALRGTSLDNLVSDGLIVMGCMPCTVSTCIVLTIAASGNASIAVLNATLSNLLGIALAPGLLILLLGDEAGIEASDKLITTLLLTLLLPFVVGMVAARFAAVQKVLKVVQPHFKLANNLILLLVVFTTFCDTFDRDIDLTTGDLASLIAIVIVAYCLYFVIARALFAAPILRLSRSDQVAALFCSTQKTVAVGIPLINILYEDNPDKGVITLPLIFYHAFQTIIGTLLLGKLARWADADPAVIAAGDIDAAGTADAGVEVNCDKASAAPVDVEQGVAL
jgi:sodium/bile acid cotransporter 7